MFYCLPIKEEKRGCDILPTELCPQARWLFEPHWLWGLATFFHPGPNAAPWFWIHRAIKCLPLSTWSHFLLRQKGIKFIQGIKLPIQSIMVQLAETFVWVIFCYLIKMVFNLQLFLLISHPESFIILQLCNAILSYCYSSFNFFCFAKKCFVSSLVLLVNKLETCKAHLLYEMMETVLSYYSTCRYPGVAEAYFAICLCLCCHLFLFSHSLSHLFFHLGLALTRTVNIV